LNPSSSDLELLSASTGKVFLQTFVDLLQEVVQPDLISISVLRVAGKESFQVQTGWIDGESLEDYEYDACYTPCLEVIRTGGLVMVHEDVQAAFPKDEFLRNKGLQSYLGVPVSNPHGEVIGLIQLGWRHRTTPEECAQVLDTISDFAGRIASELENLRMMRILKALARGPDSGAEEGVFHLITEQIQQLLSAKAGFVAECSQKDQRYFDILAYVEDGQWLHEMEGKSLTYEGRPCEHLQTREEFRIDSGLAEAYAHHPRYREAGFNAYLGIRVSGTDGSTLGHIVIFHGEALITHQLETELLAILRDRLGFEILRRRPRG
jgi:GAF domain-containing protein